MKACEILGSYAKNKDFRKSKLGFLPSKMDNLANSLNMIAGDQ